MAVHKLALGKELIEGIVHLGRVLGYHVEEEFPVDEATYGESPAVDVAWFSKKGNQFPLFIFEVESKATNGMTNNPLKVYAQENRAFEKPLFFFHVVAQGGVNSSRPRNLESQYGKNNYRIYLVGSDSANDLIKDILSQHSRVRNDVDYLSLHQLLSSSLWSNKVDYSTLLMHSVDLGLSKENIISSYIRMSSCDSDLFLDFIQLITNDSESGFSNTILDSYIGAQWHVPILYSMLCGLSEDKQKSDHWSSMLVGWQNNSSYMPMITPSFGLSRDYDEFILGCAPQLICLCIALSSNKGSFQFELIEVLEESLDKIGVSWNGLNTAIYLLHISAALQLEKPFEKAKFYLEEFKMLSESDVYQPPSVISVMEGKFDDYFHQGEGLTIPTMESFANTCAKQYQNNCCDLVPIVLKALDDDSYIYEWSNDLLESLWSKIANAAFKRN
jgi:hypothetical protein